MYTIELRTTEGRLVADTNSSTKQLAMDWAQEMIIEYKLKEKPFWVIMRKSNKTAHEIWESKTHRLTANFKFK